MALDEICFQAEDKMEKAAAESGRGALELAEEYTRLWKQDVEAVGWLPPDVLWSRAPPMALRNGWVARSGSSSESRTPVRSAPP